MGDATEAGFEGFGKSLGEVIADRFNNPMVTSFVIAWSLWNYKFFVILFSDASIQGTFKLIHEIQFNGANWFLNGVAIPLLAAAAYIFLLPFPSRYVYRSWKYSQKKTNDIKQEIEGQTLLTLDESRALRTAIRSAEKQVDDARTNAQISRQEARKAEEEIEALKAELALEELKNSRLESAIATLRTSEKLAGDESDHPFEAQNINYPDDPSFGLPGFSKYQRAVLLALARVTMLDSSDVLIRSGDSTEHEQDLEELVNRELASRVLDSREERYFITPYGRQLADEHSKRIDHYMDPALKIALDMISGPDTVR